MAYNLWQRSAYWSTLSHIEDSQGARAEFLKHLEKEHNMKTNSEEEADGLIIALAVTGSAILRWKKDIPSPDRKTLEVYLGESKPIIGRLNLVRAKYADMIRKKPGLQKVSGIVGYIKEAYAPTTEMNKLKRKTTKTLVNIANQAK